jgi:cytochrome c-type biogenesis protein CcmH
MLKTTIGRLGGVWLFLCLLALAAPACKEQRAEPQEAPEESAQDISEFVPGHGPNAPDWKPSAEGAPAQPPGEGLSRPMPSGPGEIMASRHEMSGTVKLAKGAKRPSEEGVLFVIARKAGGAGPPVAVQRIAAPKFPQAFKITAAHAMGAGAMQGEMALSARLDLDGDVGTKEPGGLLGTCAHNPVRLGQTGIVITIPSGENPPQPVAAAPAATPLPRIPERGGTITGTIRLSSGVAPPSEGVLYVLARPVGKGGAPLAVKRIDAPRFPVVYVLSQQDASAHQQAFAGEVNVAASLDADGDANTKGEEDLAGSFAGNPAKIGQAGVDMELKSK